GYFVIWEDGRTTGNLSDIYAQKYDKNGVALWAKDGIAVVATTNNEVFAPSSFYGTDTRYKSHACTDSAGGFFVAWDNPDNGNSDVRLQHILPDGSRRFDDAGYVLINRTGQNDPINYQEAQLIADGRKGFFISYIRGNRSGGYRDLFVRNYKEENGALRYNGGGQMDVYGEIQLVPTQCGNRGDLVYPDVNPKDYHIYPDGQGGCNVAFAYYLTSIVTTSTNGLVGFNRLCRVKKESHVTTRRTANLPSVPDPSAPPYNEQSFIYKKDTVLQLYNLSYSTFQTSCTIGNTGVIVNTNYVIADHGQGFLQASDGTREAEFAKGAIATVDGASDINANIIAASVKATRTGSDFWYKRVLVLPQEIYDSVPYELSSDTEYIGSGYRLTPIDPLTKINEGYDTLLGSASYQDYDFALAASNNRIFAAGKIWGPTSAYDPILINMAQMQVDRITRDSVAVHWQTPKGGTTIGKEVFTSPGAYYGNPFIATDQRGNALFSIINRERFIQVSPVADGGRLVWGAMGRSIGSGYVGTQTYQVYTPYATMNPVNGTAVIAWVNQGSFSSTGKDILMRHLDSLNYYNTMPPVRGVGVISPNYASSGTFANPVTLSGLSHTWNYFEGFNTATGVQSTMAAVFDDYNLGNTTASAIDNTNLDGTRIRKYNGVPYLDRNYTIGVENNPNGAATINVQLYFTSAQFAALQAVDATIASPADLVVIKQPKGTVENPTAYVPVAGEELISPTAWSAVDGGYYIQIPVKSFSYFFIKKNDAVLPVKWVSMTAERAAGNTALVYWKVTNEVSVKSYLVQYSEDGVHYKDGCTMNANGSGAYQCSFPISSGKYFVKIKETDLDGRSAYSSTAVIDIVKAGMHFIVSPNPVKTDAVLRYTVPAATDASLRLVSASGAVVWMSRTVLTASGTVPIPMRGLAAGLYHLQIRTKTTSESIAVTKE
ncbi:MAG: T9SS type A sorting domain-containing protein, partial [Williamsia sp.]|nr:T9SS type A sorting domain-containing protein [Williamsia sp.]